MNDGWIKLYRQLLDHPRASDPHWVALWIRLMLKATHTPLRRIFGKEEITLQPGQFITSRDSLSRETGVNGSKIERILKTLENEQQIEQRSSSVSRLITIINWGQFQKSEQPNGQQVNSDRTASEQRVNTNKNVRIEEESTHIPRRVNYAIPGSEEEAVQWCMAAGVPPEFTRSIYLQCEGRGWVDGSGQPIHMFSAYVKRRFVTEGAKQVVGSSNNTTNGKPAASTVYTMKQQLTEIEEEITRCTEEKHVMGDHFKRFPKPGMEEKVKALRIKRKELKERIQSA